MNTKLPILQPEYCLGRNLLLEPSLLDFFTDLDGIFRLLYPNIVLDLKNYDYVAPGLLIEVLRILSGKWKIDYALCEVVSLMVLLKNDICLKGFLGYIHVDILNENSECTICKKITENLSKFDTTFNRYEPNLVDVWNGPKTFALWKN